MLIGRAFNRLLRAVAVKSLKKRRTSPLYMDPFLREHYDSPIQLNSLLKERSMRSILEFRLVFSEETACVKRKFGSVSKKTIILKPRDDMMSYSPKKPTKRRYSNNDPAIDPQSKNGRKVTNEWGGPEAEKHIIHFKDNVVESVSNHESLLLLFYTSWCTHCKRMKPIYAAAALKMVEEGVPGCLGAIDLTKQMDLADTFEIVAIPLVKYYRYGKFIKIYNGTRTVDDIVAFMKDPPTEADSIPKINI